MSVGRAKMSIKIPEGFQFAPSDQELLMSYLRRWLLGHPLPWDGILERDLYGEKANPWEIFTEDDPWNIPITDDDNDDSSKGNKKTIYVFTKLPKVGRQGNKNVIRTAGCGKWHGQTGSKDIMKGKPKTKIGSKRVFTFKSSKKDLDGKGHWIMHEYSLSDAGLIGIGGSTDYVVCKITKDESKNFKKEQHSEISHVSEHGEADCEVLGKRKSREDNYIPQEEKTPRWSCSDDHQHHMTIGVDQQWSNGGNLEVQMINNGVMEAANSSIESIQNKTENDDVMRQCVSNLGDMLLADTPAESLASDDDVRRYESNLKHIMLPNSPAEFDSSAKPDNISNPTAIFSKEGSLQNNTENVRFSPAELDSLMDVSLAVFECLRENDEEYASYMNGISLGDTPVADDTSNFMPELFPDSLEPSC